jgi:hypothetical protein
MEKHHLLQQIYLKSLSAGKGKFPTVEGKLRRTLVLPM